MATTKQPTRKSEVSLVRYKQAADTAALVTNGVDAYPDDSFSGSYSVQGSNGAIAVIEPTFKPGVLKALCSSNNILSQCIEVMEVNVDGTGFSIELIPGEKENETEKKMLQNFFDEPYPNKSMVSIRRDLRVDIESTGNGYLEVIRSADGAVVMLNHLPCDDLRLIRYDDPVVVDRMLVRNGKELTVKVRARERRYVQLINGKKVYFKEFMASRDVDRNTGVWSDSKVKLPVDKRGSEILHFTMLKEPKTPYGAPRWINQLPSVLGSRKAEEFNLEFFDSGGLPPVVVIVQGGYLGDGMKDSLESYLGGKAKDKHRAAVVEAVSSSGNIDSSGSVKVSVERFGAERQQDSMFQQYDKNTEEHVRIAFRLPPLFTGRAQDYNFATALTGYMTAEAQVFAPERFEFDERMWWVVRALGVKSYTFKSKPMTLTNTDGQLKAIELALTQKIVESEGAVTALNTLTGLNLTFKEAPPPEPPPTLAHIDPLTNLPYRNPVQPVHPNDPKLLRSTGKPPGDSPAPIPQLPKPTPAGKTIPDAKANATVNKVDSFLATLSVSWCSALGLFGNCPFDDTEVQAIKGEVLKLSGDQRKVFNECMATLSLHRSEEDLEGLAELCTTASLVE